MMATKPGSAQAIEGLRAPDEVMRLARLGSFHQTRLSFLRVLLRRIANERWRYERAIFSLDGRGVGHAVYTLTRGERSYSLVCFSHELPPEKRSDRVIAEEWDATFALYDGVPREEDISRLQANVPRQEAGRCLDTELVLARANKSVRLFDAVVAALAEGRQPSATDIEATGYLMRTTAVYGNGKFGIADRDVYADRAELSGPFQAEMMAVWLIRIFTVDLVEHLARVRGGKSAVRLDRALRRRLGIGNATGLGMAPFLVRHPILIHNWIWARETALARVRSLPNATREEIARLRTLIQAARTSLVHWHTDDAVQAPRIRALDDDLARLARNGLAIADAAALPWNALYEWGARHLALEGQEYLVTLLIELHGTLVDDLAEGMSVADEAALKVDGRMSCASFRASIAEVYAWISRIDFSQKQENTRFWYVSEEKLEPRLGDRFEEPGSELEMPLAFARDIQRLSDALVAWGDQPLAGFLMAHPEHRLATRRALTAQAYPYAEIRDNLIASDLRAIDLLRCKLSFFGCTRFDPRSDKWLRITLYQGAPFPDEIGHGDWDGWIWEPAAS